MSKSPFNFSATQMMWVIEKEMMVWHSQPLLLQKDKVHRHPVLIRS